MNVTKNNMEKTKTLADFKRDIVPGVKMLCTDFVWCATDRMPARYGVPPAMQELRTVKSKNSVGFVFETGSHFEWPKASELIYSDNTVIVSPKNKNGDVFQIRTYKIMR